MPRRVPFDPARHKPMYVASALVALAEAFPDADACSSAQNESTPGGGEITLCFPAGVTVYASPPGGYKRRRSSRWRIDIANVIYSPECLDDAVARIRDEVKNRGVPLTADPFRPGVWRF